VSYFKMDLVEIIEGICKLQVGQTINSEGQIQDCANWSTSFSRRYYGDDHVKTCNYLVGKTNEAIAHIQSNQETRDRLIALLPELDLALGNYIQTCRNKKYGTDVEITIWPSKITIQKVLHLEHEEQYRKMREQQDREASIRDEISRNESSRSQKN